MGVRHPLPDTVDEYMPVSTGMYCTRRI